MRFGSVCSGIEAASVAWHPLGWRAAWLAEIDPFPSAVLKHHYPEVPNLGDMTTLPDRIRGGEVEAPDLFCGGTPCQAFSVAGLRRSLDDARGNLSLTFCEIANAIDDVRSAGRKPASIIFWENVPGVLSTADNAFGCFLGALAGCDSPVFSGGRWTDAGVVAGPQRTVAWRILDAQFFGLAQRRRRVFVVASARDGFDPAAVLFEWEGLRRDSAPSREAGEGPAPCVTAGAGNGGAAHGARSGSAKDNLIVPVSSMCLNAKGGVGRLDAESETLIPTIGGGFDGPVGITLHGTDGTASVASLTDLSSSLRARIPSGVENSTTTAVMQPVTYDFFNITAPVNRQSRKPGDPCHTLARSNAEHAVVMRPVAIQDVRVMDKAQNGRGWNDDGTAYTVDTHATQGVAVARPIDPFLGGEVTIAIDASYAKGCGGTSVAERPVVAQAMQVRRLTPVECERLQGFPDNYTAIPWRNKPTSECPDGPRYKALGNSWAVPVVRWIGRRINRFLEATA